MTRNCECLPSFAVGRATASLGDVQIPNPPDIPIFSSVSTALPAGHFRHILVPLYGKFLPRAALMKAALLAGEQGAKLTLLHISDDSVDFAQAGITAALESHVKQHEERVRHVLEDALSITAEFGATAGVHIAKGHPVHSAISNVAASLGADLIIMGKRKRHSVIRALRGCVADDVRRACPVPVFVVDESQK